MIEGNSKIIQGKNLILSVIDKMCCLVITDAEGRYTYANKVWCQTMNIDFDLDKIKGRYVHEIVADTKIDIALRNNCSISGYSTIKIGKAMRRAFSIYTPIINDGKQVIAGTIMTIFTGDDESDLQSKTDLLISELKYYKKELSKMKGVKYSIENIVGDSRAALKMKEEIRIAARSNSTVLITGETGSGKELVAHALHGLSNRATENFVKVNCACIPSELLESEFFGYEEGAFTGAKKKGKIGKFEQADGGSIFLDEINQLSYQLQPKLLRVIQEREIERVGGNKSVLIDTRIIASTNVSLEEMVKNNQFRRDLYYRLNVITINVPPLKRTGRGYPVNCRFVA